MTNENQNNTTTEENTSSPDHGTFVLDLGSPNPAYVGADQTPVLELEKKIAEVISTARGINIVPDLKGQILEHLTDASVLLQQFRMAFMQTPRVSIDAGVADALGIADILKEINASALEDLESPVSHFPKEGADMEHARSILVRKEPTTTENNINPENPGGMRGRIPGLVHVDNFLFQPEDPAARGVDLLQANTPMDNTDPSRKEPNREVQFQGNVQPNENTDRNRQHISDTLGLDKND